MQDFKEDVHEMLVYTHEANFEKTKEFYSNEVIQHTHAYLHSTVLQKFINLGYQA